MKKTLKIAVANIKGGVGKTTAALNIGLAFASLWFNVRFIDLDQQCDLTDFLLGDTQIPTTTLYTSLLSNKYPTVIHNNRENVSFIPGSHRMEEAIQELMIKQGRTMEEYNMGKIDKPFSAIYHVVNILDNISSNDECEIEILDCPPSAGVMVLAGLIHSDFLIIPTQATDFSARQTRNFIKNYVPAIQRINPNFKVMGILINMKRNEISQIKIANKLREEFGELVFNNEITYNASVNSAYHQKMSIFEYQDILPTKNLPDVALYKYLVDEIIDRANLTETAMSKILDFAKSNRQ